eukprot:SAG31_NODE_2428_length_5715_cov_6.736111_6_plen_341_part_00
MMSSPFCQPSFVNPRCCWRPGVAMLLLLLCSHMVTTTALTSLPPCKSDLDCSLNGVCDKTTGVCACDEPWTSNLDGANKLPACGFLRFSRNGSPNNASQSPAGVFHGVNKEWTSWGASVVRGRDKKYHAFVAEMANECGLGTWQQNSQVVHAVAATPAGPFQRVDVVVPPLSHNPQVMIAPDGTAVIYTLFDGWSAGEKNCNKTGSTSAGGATSGPQLGSGSGGVGNCTVIPGDTNCDPGPCWQCTITMHASSDINAPGPWQSYRTQIIGLANNNGIPNYNPTALVLKNGSIALMIHDKDQWSGLSIAIAETWKGPYRITVPDGPITTCTKCLEDPCKLV